MSDTSYLHSLANYPKGFRGTVISPTKICLQFENVQVKFRQNDKSSEWLKMPNGHRAIAIEDTGTDVLYSAMGCQMPTLEAVQFGLITAYISYAKYHSKTYKETYGKDFLDFLLQARAELTGAINKVRAITEDETR